MDNATTSAEGGGAVLVHLVLQKVQEFFYKVVQCQAPAKEARCWEIWKGNNLGHRNHYAAFMSTNKQ